MTSFNRARSCKRVATGATLELVPAAQMNPEGPIRRTLASLREGETGVLDGCQLSDDFSQRLMQLGFIPGNVVEAAHSAPGGDPRVYRVDGSEVALRRETAQGLIII